MSDAPLDIEQIVRLCLRRLRELGVVEGNGAVSRPEVARPRSEATANGSGEPGTLVLNERVVSLSVLQDRLRDARRVLVRHDAVVTPAVHDALRQSGVALDVATTPLAPAADTRLVVGLAEVSGNTAGWLKALGPPVVGAARVPAAKLTDAVQQLNECVLDGQLGLLLTSQTAVALCLANRCRGVRAVLGSRPSEVRKAIDALAANLLVVDPAAGNVFQLREMIRLFVAAGPQPCPETLQRLLEGGSR